MLSSLGEAAAILIVDDEPQVAVALADVFEDEYRVVTETSGESALKALKSVSGIATILCDQRMPGMSGDELLAAAKDLSPASRLLITGYADLQAVIRAVNEGQIFGYISKPWDPDGLKLTVHKAVEYYELRQELNRERRLLRDLMRHSPDAIAFKDPALRYVHLNEAEAKLIGAPEPASAVGRPARDFVSADRSRRLTRQERSLLRSGKVQLDRIERVAMADGSVRWYAANRAAIRNDQDEVTGLVAITRDITQAKGGEARLQLREAQLSEAQRMGRLGHWSLDLASVHYECSDVLYRIYGLEPGSPVTWDTVVGMIHEDDRVQANAVRARAIREKSGYEFAFRIRRADGELRFLEGRASPQFDDNGQMTGIFGVTQDVSEQRMAQEALRQSEASLVAAQRIAQIGSWVWNMTDQSAVPSRELCRMLGFAESLEDFSFETLLGTIHEDDRPRLQDAFTMAIETGGKTESTCRLLRADGEERDVVIEIEVEGGAAGAPRRMIGAVQDVTERMRLEQQLRQAQKMEAIGQLTGGVAHDFNNLLTVIIGNLQLAQSKLNGDPRVTNWLATAERAASRGGDLTKRLLAFSRQQVLEAKPTNINRLIAEMEEIFRRTLGETIGIEVLLAPDLWPVRVDDGELANALLNLVVNARDAMPRGGSLTIETANVVLKGEYVRQHPYVVPGEYVLLAVSDSGVGIPEEMHERIFEPFFTTKEAGKGTGLGMSMVYGFIKQSGGHIEIYSEVGTGTTVKIYLPRLSAAGDMEREQGRDEQKAGESIRPDVTILVVEDDPDLRATLVDILDALGYKIIEAVDGPDALAKIEQNPGIDVLFTDYIMPGGMDGMELTQQARQRNPAIKILLTSGYTRRALLRREELGDALDWIAKPYNAEEVANKLREILKRRPTSDLS